jgi:hypothetical protein
MRTTCRMIERGAPAIIALVVIGAMAAGIPAPAAGQSSYGMEFCKRIEPRAGVGLITRQCGTTFTAADSYIGIVVHLYEVTESVSVAVELQDPGQAVVWRRSEAIQVRPGYYYPTYWVWTVLPIAADETALATESPRLAAERIRLEGTPARERLGDWTLNLRLNNGRPATKRFTLRGP